MKYIHYTTEKVNIIQPPGCHFSKSAQWRAGGRDLLVHCCLDRNGMHLCGPGRAFFNVSMMATSKLLTRLTILQGTDIWRSVPLVRNVSTTIDDEIHELRYR